MTGRFVVEAVQKNRFHAVTPAVTRRRPQRQARLMDEPLWLKLPLLAVRVSLAPVEVSAIWTQPMGWAGSKL